MKEADLARSGWIDPTAGDVPLAEYALNWIRERPGLRPKMLVLYEGILRNHIAATLGSRPVRSLTAPMLLRSILATAVDDHLIESNPCHIKGAAVEHSPERPVLAVREVYQLADGMQCRFRALVLVAAMGSLRWGELAGLQSICRRSSCMTCGSTSTSM